MIEAALFKKSQELLTIHMPHTKWIKHTIENYVILFQYSELVLNELTTVRAPVFGRHQFFGTSEHYGKTHGSLLSGWMNYNYTARCWFPTSSNILILPSQFWQIRFESYWWHCSKCRILVLLRYIKLVFILLQWYNSLHQKSCITCKPTVSSDLIFTSVMQNYKLRSTHLDPLDISVVLDLRPFLSTSSQITHIPLPNGNVMLSA